jgi:hypothetical protein
MLHSSGHRGQWKMWEKDPRSWQAHLPLDHNIALFHLRDRQEMSIVARLPDSFRSWRLAGERTIFGQMVGSGSCLNPVLHVLDRGSFGYEGLLVVLLSVPSSEHHSILNNPPCVGAHTALCRRELERGCVRPKKEASLRFGVKIIRVLYVGIPSVSSISLRTIIRDLFV